MFSIEQASICLLTYTHQKVKARSSMKMCPIQSLPCETFYELNISEKKKKCTEVSVNHFEHLIFNLLQVLTYFLQFAVIFMKVCWIYEEIDYVDFF